MPGRDHHLDLPERGRLAERAAAISGDPAEPPPPMPPWSGDLHPFWGLHLLSETNEATGAVATQSVNPAGSQDQVDFLYSPTLHPGGGACIEVTTVYRDGLYVTPYDWCGNPPRGFQPGLEVDAAFQADYVQDLAYTLKIEQTDATTNEWTAFLYNHTTSAWDSFYVSAGPSGLTNGWTVFEVYTEYNSATTVGHYCDRTAGYTFTSSDVQTKIGGVWVDADASNSVPSDIPLPGDNSFGCPNMDFGHDAPNHFTVSNPPLACTVEYAPNSWGTGFTANVTIENPNDYHINGWSLLWTFAGNQAITNSWNSVYGQVGQDVTISNNPSTNTISAGSSINFGFQGTYSGVNDTPETFTLDTGYTPSDCVVT